MGEPRKYTPEIEQAGAIAARVAMDFWGKGWERLSDDARAEAVAAAVFHCAAGSGAEVVRVETLWAIFAVAKRKAGVEQ